MTKIAGSGYESGSISQRHGSADPDPPQNVMDLQHCWQVREGFADGKENPGTNLTVRVFLHKWICFLSAIVGTAKLLSLDISKPGGKL
jgi:hypothetical protein